MDLIYDDLLSAKKELSRYMVRVYNWMFVALCVSGGTAYYVTHSSEQVLMIVLQMFYPLILVELGVVVLLGWLLHKIPSFLAAILFIAYSILNGLTLSVIFLAYPVGSIALAFAITAGTFLFMSIYGYTTENDLSGFGSVMIVGLFGLILASVVNYFLGSQLLDYILSWVAVVVFTGLTAYDTQKIKEMALVSDANGEESKKGAIMGALALYLDFINLFLAILRIFGSRD